jgi:hypothetical protein
MTTDHNPTRRPAETPDNTSATSPEAGLLQRAMGQTLPKALTPYGWEQWYAEYGVPDSHINPQEKQVGRRWHGGSE